LDALDPADLQALYQEVSDEFWDVSAYEEVLNRERRERQVLRTIRVEVPHEEDEEDEE
jgi:hypothetical protein